MERIREAVALCLEADQESLDAYLNGPIIGALRELKEVSDIRVRQFDVMEEASAITRGLGAQVASPV